MCMLGVSASVESFFEHHQRATYCTSLCTVIFSKRPSTERHPARPDLPVFTPCSHQEKTALTGPIRDPLLGCLSVGASELSSPPCLRANRTTLRSAEEVLGKREVGLWAVWKEEVPQRKRDLVSRPGETGAERGKSKKRLFACWMEQRQKQKMMKKTMKQVYDIQEQKEEELCLHILGLRQEMQMRILPIARERKLRDRRRSYPMKMLLMKRNDAEN